MAKDVDKSLPLDRGRRFYNRRVVEALEKSDINRAGAIVETLHRRNPDKTVLWPYTYNLLLRHYCKQQKTIANTNLARILALLDVMVAQGCADQASYQVAMAACSRARHLPSAQRVLEKMEAVGQQPDARIYGFLINCCARKQGKVAMADEYFDEMLCTGVKPTVLVTNAMLRVYSRDSGRSKLMLDLVNRLREEYGLVPDTVTTRTLVYYLLCENDVDTAVEYLRRVVSDFPFDEAINLPVKRQVMNSLIDACRQRGDWNSAEYVCTLVKRTEEDNFATDSSTSVRDTEKLEQLVVHRDASSPSVAWTLKEQGLSRMSRGDRETFFRNRNKEESVQRALEQMGQRAPVSRVDGSIEKLSVKLEGKLRVLDEMVQTKSASAREFNAVLSTCGRQGRLTDAVAVLDIMKKYAESMADCAPTTWSYNTLLNACAVRGDIDQVESIINEMVDNDLLLDQVTMNTVLKAHTMNLKDGLNGSSQTPLTTVMQALSFYEWCTENQKLNTGAATYYSLFRLFVTYLETPDGHSSSPVEDDSGVSSDEKDTESQEGELVAWMTEFITTACRDAPLGSLDTGVFNSAFDFYHRLGDVDGSFALFNLMKKRGVEPDDSTLGLMFATCASQQQFEVGLNFLDHLMTAEGYKPTLKVLSGAIQLCANSKNPDGALELFRAIEESGTYTPTVETYEPVVFAYGRVGNVSSAWEIANEMEEKLGRVSVSIYNRILLACVEAALPGRALDVLGVIRHKEGVRADVISFNTALEAFVRAGERAAWWRKNNVGWEEDADFDDDNEDEEGLDVEYLDGKMTEDMANVNDPNALEEVRKKETPDIEQEHLEKALWARVSIIDLLEEMQRSRVKPDMTTYERAIATCSVNEDSEGVIAIFDKLIDRKRGHQAVALKSDLVSDSSFSAYLVACTALQDKDRIVEAPTLLHKWHTTTGQIPPEFVVMQLLDSLEGLGEWHSAVRMLPNWQKLFGVPPSVDVFNRVMEMCNCAGEHQLVAPIFATMQDAAAYRIYPDAESYIQRIYAEEQRENWVAATDLFVEMRKKCPSEGISHQQLQKIALGRYRLRQSQH
ncbi:Pentatricopeptide repeat-containing protein [Phytophthora citrophthora]|uniref:Pentatricopeptide repeat-containing protein n=1 Tax=Phytophthora citrophthora TaxID=4793 RepID=A0AAD9LQY4_9STRA|nr:Pentatricopeptide repeat-containing protein [Phytophthora citrophthora]